MSVPTLSVSSEVTPAWVSSCLRDAGRLVNGDVVDVASLDTGAFNSSTVRLAVSYSSDTPPADRVDLVLKRCRGGDGELEVAFYRRAAAALPAGVVPECVSASFDATTCASHVLLVDASATHDTVVTRDRLIGLDGVPHADRLRAVMTALARFHAAWWGSSELGGEAPFAARTWFRDQAAFEALVDRRRREWSGAVERAPQALSLHQSLFEHAFLSMDTAWRSSFADRVAARRHLTLTHGDCYLSQHLASSDNSHVFLADFDSVSAGFATFDLTFLLATFWTSEQRQQHEAACLRLYYEALCLAGVTGYDFDHLLDDYRLMLPFVVFDVIFDIANDSRPQYWEPKLECLTSAYREWCMQ